MADVKLGCIPYENRPDRSPVEGAGRGLSHFRRPSTRRQLPNRVGGGGGGGIPTLFRLAFHEWPLERGPPHGQGPVAMGKLDQRMNTTTTTLLPLPLTKATAAEPPTAEPSGPFPSSAPAVPGRMMGSISTNRAKDRADAQRLVTTRLLDRLHDPLGHFSRLQRIYPRAR